MPNKWRPTIEGCVYVLGDIHGMMHQLNLICSQILPLRKNDHLVFLGDYIDRHKDSTKVLDFLIQLKAKYHDQVVLIRGNHEQMFLNAIQLGSAMANIYEFWRNNGGNETLSGYLERAGSTIQPHLLPRSRLQDLIPKEHISLIKNDMVDYYEFDDYIFVHAGCDPLIPMNIQNQEIFWWDRSLFNYTKLLKLKMESCNWNKIIVTGHNTDFSNEPFIYDKFIMLDTSSCKSIHVMELNSKEICRAGDKKTKLFKLNKDWL